MGKLTISTAIFNSYVKLPEGTKNVQSWVLHSSWSHLRSLQWATSTTVQKTDEDCRKVCCVSCGLGCGESSIIQLWDRRLMLGLLVMMAPSKPFLSPVASPVSDMVLSRWTCWSKCYRREKNSNQRKQGCLMMSYVSNCIHHHWLIDSEKKKVWLSEVGAWQPDFSR